MKIELISVSSVSEGAEMLLTFVLDSEDGKKERRKLLVFTEKYLELGLRKGAILDTDTFDEVERISRECVAIRKGSNLLSYSSSSKVRLARRLRSKGIDAQSAKNAALRLEEMGLIDEEADVERAVQACLKKLWGKKRIYRELMAKGYEKECISRELACVSEEELVKNCVALFYKKHKVFPDDVETQKKIVASLVRYGYGFSEIKQALVIIEREQDE